MVEASSPDLLRVTGLVFEIFGMLLLGKVVTSYAHLATDERVRQELTANRRHVGMWFCLPVIVIGLLFQIGSEFYRDLPTGFLALSLVALAFWLLIFLLVEDHLSERMYDIRAERTKRRMPKTEPPVRYLSRQTSTHAPTSHSDVA